MGVRRVRILVGVVAAWLLVSYHYGWPNLGGSGFFSPTPDTHAASGPVRWRRLTTRYPVKSLASLPTDLPAKPVPRVQAPKPQEKTAERDKRLERLGAVKESFVHSWEGYKKQAWGHDEIKPISGDYKDPFGGWAATLVDSLDSLWLMGLTDEFEMAARACAEIDFTTTKARDINVFETTIRYLGGFLAAYELSEKQYPILLKKATEIADLLMTAFDTPNRMPITRFPWKDYMKGKDLKAGSSVLVAEIGSLSLEFTKMSQLTGDMQYYDAVQRIYDELEEGQSRSSLPGMWPVIVNAARSPMEFKGDSFSLGGMSDSTFEYLGKQYLLLGGAFEQPRKLYENFIEVAEKHLLRSALNPEDRPIMFFGDVRIANPPGDEAPYPVTSPRAQHLTCFAGGMVGMAAKIFDRPADLDVAAQLTDGCVWSYSSTKTGIGPEIFHFIPCEPDSRMDDCKWSERRWIDSVKKHWTPSSQSKDFHKMPDERAENIIDTRRLPSGMVDVNDPRYILRPEAIESVFYMLRMTGDSRWMDKAWDMFTAVEKFTRTSYASAALDDITYKKPSQVDSMESFWLAETLKYFYLIFGEWDLADLDQWVLNTEAHPLRRADAGGG
ncbi:glycoside hydrolase [Xylariaceae sp. FL0016]|nr:glycoside hydrolase [Xylariaceae sp. FL0016]